MKKSFFYYLSLCLMGSVMLASCSDDEEGGGSGVENEQPAVYSIKLSAPQKRVLSQSNDFAFDVLKAFNNERGNVFLSPYSLGQAIAMIANGAQGETFDELANILKIGENTTVDDINNYYAMMNQSLIGINCSSKLAIANSVWTNTNFPVLATYTTDMGSYFNAKVEAIDFANGTSINQINQWANQTTKGMIPNIVNEISPQCRMLVLNSLYFKGLWKYFPKKNTYDDTFRNQFDKNEKVKMMKSNKHSINGCITDEELIAEFDYSGKAFQLQVIMPTKGSINDYINSFDSEKYHRLLVEMNVAQSVVCMPKFKFTCENNFNQTLQKMGVTRAFSENANFGKISAQPGVYLSKIFQRATLEVNEDGTVAAAVSGGSMSDTADLPEKFTIDHPFIYIIRERTTGVILFIGKVQTIEGMQ